MIYGTPDRPRPPILRGIVRLIAFPGAAVIFAGLAGAVDLSRVASYAYIPWGLCGLVVLIAEDSLGNRWVAGAAWGAACALLIAAIAWEP